MLAAVERRQGNVRVLARLSDQRVVDIATEVELGSASQHGCCRLGGGRYQMRRRGPRSEQVRRRACRLPKGTPQLRKCFSHDDHRDSCGGRQRRPGDAVELMIFDQRGEER